MIAKLTMLSACLSLAAIPLVRSAIIDVVVGGDGIIAFTPNQVVAQVSDIIQFTFKQKNHTVTQSSLASPCSPLEDGFDSGFVPVAANETDFPVAQLTVKSTDPIWVYCKQTGHCQQLGMVFAVNPGDKFAAFQAAANGSAVSVAPPSAIAAGSVVTVTATVTTGSTDPTSAPASDTSSTNAATFLHPTRSAAVMLALVLGLVL
ncbi:hypothetical protein C8F01DRAFT_1133037 [Mycena amicta]|nr:hypothetical protein C8F01DRAFT_1133037 [Mycena amicta]